MFGRHPHPAGAGAAAAGFSARSGEDRLPRPRAKPPCGKGSAPAGSAAVQLSLNRVRLLWVYTESTSPTLIYIIMVEDMPAE